MFVPKVFSCGNKKRVLYGMLIWVRNAQSLFTTGFENSHKWLRRLDADSWLDD